MAIYLLHFDRPLAHARHYLGWAPDDKVDARIRRHGTAKGARMMLHVARAGIAWDVARVWPGADRTQERQMKRWKKIHRYCPICKAERGAGS